MPISNYPIENTTNVPFVVVYEEFDESSGEWLPCTDDSAAIVEPGETYAIQLEVGKRRATVGSLRDDA